MAQRDTPTPPRPATFDTLDDCRRYFAYLLVDYLPDISDAEFAVFLEVVEKFRVERLNPEGHDDQG